MTAPASPSYAGHRFPAEVISHAVWLYFRFPLSLRNVEEMLAARGVIVSHETVREFVARIGWLAPGDGWRRRTTPSVTQDLHCAVQGQCPSPSSHPQAAAQGHELAGLRRQLTPAGELDGLAHRRSDRGLEG